MKASSNSRTGEGGGPVYHRSDALISQARRLGAVRTGVVYPCSRDALAGALEAQAAGLIEPILIGPEARIREIAERDGYDLTGCRIEDIAEPVAAARLAAESVRTGRLELLMKGSLHTDELMSVVVSRDAALRTARRVSHVFVMDLPQHERLLLISDAAVNIAPSLPVKVDIVRNALDVARAIDIPKPNVAVLSAVENVNPDIPSTGDAALLAEMAHHGDFGDVVLHGPLAFDNAISLEAARIKGIDSPVCGDVDVMIVPNLEAGNILYKALVYLAGGLAGGVVAGARVPIILTSRADSPASRTASAAIACLHAHHLRATSKRSG
jgi:phosphate acetyltransferase